MHQMRRIEVRVEHVSGSGIQQLRVPVQESEPGTMTIEVKVTTPPMSTITVPYRTVDVDRARSGRDGPDCD